jgi:hypothetical protein
VLVGFDPRALDQRNDVPPGGLAPAFRNQIEKRAADELLGQAKYRQYAR